MTYMPSLVQELVQKHVAVLNAQDLQQMAGDVEERDHPTPGGGHGLGMDFDAEGWRRFAAWCRETAATKPPT
jgi:hypothetical protein